MDLEKFRFETRDFLGENCPESMRNRPVHFEDAFEIYSTDEAHLWRDRMAARGWTAPMWPKEYTGGGLSFEENQVLQQEMAAIKALPASAGMGLAMIGPTLFFRILLSEPFKSKSVKNTKSAPFRLARFESRTFPDVSPSA